MTDKNGCLRASRGSGCGGRTPKIQANGASVGEGGWLLGSRAFSQGRLEKAKEETLGSAWRLHESLVDSRALVPCTDNRAGGRHRPGTWRKAAWSGLGIVEGRFLSSVLVQLSLQTEGGRRSAWNSGGDGQHHSARIALSSGTGCGTWPRS